jgi:hypothetical protein
MKKPVKYPIVIFFGILFGIFVILPINEFTSYYEYHLSSDVTVWQFVGKQVLKAITFQTPLKFFFYFVIGGFVGLILVLLIAYFRKRNKLLIHLNSEISQDYTELIAQGENDRVEFKSSFRYDYKLTIK